jgi:hypothetical protein
LFDQQTAEARAVEKQLAFHLRAVRQFHGRDVARFPMQRDIDDPALDALDAALLAELAEKLRVQPGVEVEGVRDFIQR